MSSVGQHGLVGALEALDDLLVVLEHVPDPLRRVVDVVEVDVEVLGDVALGALEVLQRRPLRADDLAEVDDLLLDVGDVADDLLGAPLEDRLLQALELVAHLAQHRERRVDAVVDDLVEEVSRALGEELLAEVVARPGALEEVLERLDRVVGQRDDVVRPEEDVELDRVEPPDLLVEGREVQDDEEVLGVLVELRALVAREDVLVVEGVEVEVLLQPGALGLAGALDVDPAQAGVLDDLDLGLLRLVLDARDRATRPHGPAQAGLGQARHGSYFAARRGSASGGSGLQCTGGCGHLRPV